MPASTSSSQEWGENHPPARILGPPVLPVEQLPETAVLPERPVGHDGCRDGEEDVASHSLRGDVETQPLVDLGGVVCTCHDVEQETTWDLITTAACRATEVPQQDMAVEVCDLANNPDAKPNLHLQITHGGVKRVGAVVGDVGSKCPVVGAVPEDI